MSLSPRRGRREEWGASFVDLTPPQPIAEKRNHSPFSFLRLRKFSTEGKRKPRQDIEPLPPVPSIFGKHNRNYSDPELVRGHASVPVRSPPSDSSDLTLYNESPTPPTASPREFTRSWEAPSVEEVFPSVGEYVPPASLLVAAQSAMTVPPQERGDTSSRSMAPTGIKDTVRMDKAKIAATGPMIAAGMLNMTRAQGVIHQVIASEAWSVAKEQVQRPPCARQGCAGHLDSVTRYIPALMVAESIFSVIIKHELDRHDNDKNILVVYHTMSIFWFTLCDLQVIFRAAEQIKTSLDTFFEAVGKTMQDFGNFRDVYYRHGHFARTLRSGEYREKLTAFAQDFAGHKSNLQFILAESSAIKLNEMSGDLNNMSGKLDVILRFIGQQTPLEQSVARQLENHGGAEVALKNPRFLHDLARNTFHEKLSPQVQASLRQGLDDALKANLPMFTLKVEAAQKEIKDSIERSTETILQELNSGPHELIKDEDIKANWRISCKARHFVDAVHNHFAQKFVEHKRTSGSSHPEQWTLKVLSQVIYYRNISDAIDDDGSGYISVLEVNKFLKSRPRDWSAPQWLSFWAAGWKQNASTYTLFANIEASAKRVLPQNRRAVKSYVKTSGLSELWLIVNSLNADGAATNGRRPISDVEPLHVLRLKIMDKETHRIQSRLERILYQLESPETVIAVLGTHRLEGFILCFLKLILDRHCKIIEAANTFVLSDREFETMTFSLKNLVAAIGSRYRNLTETWKQQRLDTGFLVQCFAGGIFSDWHDVFQDTLSESPAGSPVAESSPSQDIDRADTPGTLLRLPSQSERYISKRPLEPRRSVRRNGHDRWSGYFYNFDFEKPKTGEAEGASISEIYRKPKKPKLEDRIASLESELSTIKGMLTQLITVSTPPANV
ncbi:hypothetical protein C8J57DRAFT_1376350 [Mycena rebaudengoi]|nr:hypothetical protein C8J57DRAFT_1376350 [Mycena rebaudengoi]